MILSDHTSSFATGFAVSGALIAAIGAQNMFVLRQGLKREHVGTVILICACADALLVAVGVAGLGAVLGRAPALSRALTLGGAAFLTWYGVQAMRRALDPGALQPTSGQSPSSLRAIVGKTAAFTFLNPHVYLDTVMLMGAIGAAQPGFGRWAFVAGAAAASGTWFAALGYGARLFGPLLAQPIAWRVLDGVVAVTMLMLALGLLLR